MEQSVYDLLMSKSEKHRLEFLPHISIDCVVFGFHEASLKVLLLKMKGEDTWSLPGGYVGKQEDLEEAANRILEERTGATNIYLQQFKVFSDPNRSQHFFAEMPDALWHKQRFVSVGFYALIPYLSVTPVSDEASDVCLWCDIHDMPALMMDHQQIFEGALLSLRRELTYKPIGYNLLPEEFTLPELQKLYEIILGRKLNRGNFYRKIMAYDVLDKLEGARRGGAHKAPYLYKFNQEKYKAALHNGFKDNW
ncbi:NUDIX hydrolase [Flexibacter flexilis]|nr:NUDIX domain-containing protein [Flexibacter flexilis]